MNRNRLNVAVVSPNDNKYSETFIRFHKERLPHEVYFFFNNFLPEESEMEGRFFRKSIVNRLIVKLEKKFFPQKLNLHERGLARLFRKYQIKVVLAEYGMTGAELTRTCRKLNIPLFVHFHGYDASVRDVIAAWESKFKVMFGYASGVFAVSKDMKRKLIQMGCPPDKIILNYYGPSDLFFDNTPTYNAQTIIAVGRFVEKKAPLLTLQAFKYVLEDFSEALLYFVGDGPLLKTAVEKAREWGIEEKVKFKAVLPPEDIRQLFSRSSVFVQHSIEAPNGDCEGTPVAILEAGAAGLAVVSTRHAGIKDVVIHGETGFLCSEGDIDAMALYIKRLLGDPSLCESFGKAARVRIAAEFTLERHLNIISQHMSKAVKKNS